MLPWDAHDHDWACSRLSLVRSTWDYHLVRRKWEAWLNAASRSTQILNAPSLLHWNTDKCPLAERPPHESNQPPPLDLIQ